MKRIISLSFRTNQRWSNVCFGHWFGWTFIFPRNLSKGCGIGSDPMPSNSNLNRNKQFFLWEMCKLTNEMNFTICLDLSVDLPESHEVTQILIKNTSFLLFVWCGIVKRSKSKIKWKMHRIISSSIHFKWIDIFYSFFPLSLSDFCLLYYCIFDLDCGKEDIKSQCEQHNTPSNYNGIECWFLSFSFFVHMVYSFKMNFHRLPFDGSDIIVRE